MHKDKLVRDVWTTLTKKLKKLNPRDYYFRITVEEFDDEPEIIEMNLPISKLRNYSLEAVKRTFADDPKPEESRHWRQSTMERFTSNMPTNVDEQMFIWNEYSASQKEVCFSSVGAQD